MLLIWLVILFASLLTVNVLSFPKFITVDVLKHGESVQPKGATATNYQLHGNNTRPAINASHTNASPNNSTFNIPRIEIAQTLWLQPLVQFAVSGTIAGVGLFFANLALDRHRKPKLFIDKTNSPKVVH